MAKFQELFIKELKDNIVKGIPPEDIVKKHIKNISYEDITDEYLEQMDLNITNIFIEFLANEIIEKKFINNNAVKCSHDLLYSLLIYFHPKLFEYIFSGKTIEEYNKHRLNMLSTVNSLLENNKQKLTTEHFKRLDNTKKLLEISPREDIDKITSFEYCFYMSWASFKKEFVDISQEELKIKNDFDILAINARYNFKHDDALIIYNNISDEYIPVLSSSMIERTKRFNYFPPTFSPKTPLSLYDKNFQKIDKLTSDNVCVVIDYNNGFYTKLFIGTNEITKHFAESIIDRKIIPNYNKKLLRSQCLKDIFSFLPVECYEGKLDSKLITENTNKLKKIVFESFTTNIKEIINNIMIHKQLPQILPNEHDREFFKVYLSYLYNLETVDINSVIEIVQNYLYENIDIIEI